MVPSYDSLCHSFFILGGKDMFKELDKRKVSEVEKEIEGRTNTPEKNGQSYDEFLKSDKRNQHSYFQTQRISLQNSVVLSLCT